MQRSKNGFSDAIKTCLCKKTELSCFRLLPCCMECRCSLAMRILSIRLSVRLSVKCLVFWKKEWLVGATPSTQYFGSNGPCWSKIADFRSIFACSTSAVTSSEKSSINTNRKSSTHFPMSRRGTSYVVPKHPNDGSKMQSVHNLNNKLR